MRRISKPLDQQAVASADEKIYAAHESDPRPNALYDADGNRKPLDADDPDQEDLRQEWREAYFEALDAKNKNTSATPRPKAPAPKQPSTKPPAPPSPPDEREVGKSVQPCPDDHWITVVVWPLPDVRPAYWSPAPDSSLYAGEMYSAEITDGHKDSTLDGNGGFEYWHIPSGQCKFWLSAFNAVIELFMDDKVSSASKSA